MSDGNAKLEREQLGLDVDTHLRLKSNHQKLDSS
jgi:hypothetical protein